jgi:hypothetical protein
VRLDDYLKAFRYYLSIPDELVNQIVVLENSDSDLTSFANLAIQIQSSKDIRLINTTSDYAAEQGKGFSEFLMVDAGLDFLVQAGHLEPQSTLWKITGRLICANLAAMIESAPVKYSVYCDLRTVPFIGDYLGGNDWMDLRIFSCTVEAYDEYFRNRYGVHRTLEKGFFNIVKTAMRKDVQISPRFRLQPEIHGFGGFDNRDYRSLSYRAKDVFRGTTRRFLPSLWI